MKYLGINLTKEVKELYNESYKTLKKLRQTLAGRKTCHVHVLSELIV
jgi:hypothetical protein